MLKPVLRDQTVSVVSMSDPSFDLDASRTVTHEGKEILAYARERFRDPSSWRETMVVRDGERPTEFIIGIIPPAEMARIEDECSRGEQNHWRSQCWRSFVASLCDVKHGFDLSDVSRETIDSVSYVTPAWIRETFVGTLYDVAIEIGAVSWNWNRMAGADAKN